MTPMMSVIGSSIRKMFSALGGSGDVYWDNTTLLLYGENKQDQYWSKTSLEMHMDLPDPYWANVALGLHMDVKGDLEWTSTSLNMRMNGANNGTVFTDDKGLVFTRSGTVVTSTANKRFGTASLYFPPASSSYLNLAGTVPTLQFGTGDFTMEAWIYPTDMTAYSPIFARDLGTGDNDYFFGLLPDSMGGFLVMDIAGTIQATDTKAMQLNTWTHVAVSRNDGVISLFVNGKRVARVNNSTSMNPNGDTRIGRGRGTSSNYFIGYIDDLRVTKGVGRYASDFVPSTVELPSVAGSLTSIIDEKGKTVNVNGNAKLSTSEKMFGERSCYFDSIGDYLSVPTSTDFDFGTGDFTVEAWAMRLTQPAIDNDGARGAIIVARSAATGGSNIFYMLQYNDTMLFASNNNAQHFSVAVPGGWQNNRWYHMAIVRISGVVTLYLDGKALGSFAHTATISGTQPVLIGGRAFSSNYYWYHTGYIDDVRITKGVGRYNKDFNPPIRAFPGAETFLDEKLKLPYLLGAPAMATDQSKFGGYSGYFSGTLDKVAFPHSTDFGLAKGDFTVECWVMTNVSRTVVDLRERVNNACAFAIESGCMAFWIGDRFVTGVTQVATSTWTHLAWVRSKGTITFYVNGIADGSFYYPVHLGFDRPCSVGGDILGTSLFTGYIDDLRITKAARYTAEFSPFKYPNKDFQNTPLVLDESGKILSTAYPNFSENAKFGASSLAFNGSTSYLSYPSNADFNFGNDDFTVEFWIQPLSFTNTFQTVLANGVAPFALTSNAIMLYSDGYMGMVYDIPSTSQNNVILTTTPLVLNQWAHIAFENDSGTLKCFVNGILQASALNPIAWDFSLNGTFIGKNAWDSGTSAFLHANLDNLRITKGIARYTSNFTLGQKTAPNYKKLNYDPYFTNVSLGLHMEGANAGTVFTDVTGRVMTPVGNVVTSTAQKKIGTTSAKFDGAGDYISTPYTKLINVTEHSAWTIEAWVYLNVSGTFCLYSVRNSDTARWSIEFTPTDVSGYYHGSFPFTQPVGRWFHFAETWDGNKRRVFIDGVKLAAESSTNYAHPAFSSGLACIGYTQRASFEYYLNGYIDEFRITTGVCRYTTNFNPSRLPFPDSGVPEIPELADPYFGNVVLGMHMDGADAGTVFTDIKGHTVTVTGNVNTTTALKKFGTASAYFDGAGDYIKVGPSSDFNLGTGEFTVECWFFAQTQIVAYPVVFSCYNSVPEDFGLLVKSDGSGELLYGGTHYDFGAGTIPTFRWVHCAIVRSETTLVLYIDGVSKAQVTYSGNVARSDVPFTLGCVNSGSTNHTFKGYIDDFRITNGVCRYTKTFSPPGRFADAGLPDQFWGTTVLALPLDGPDNSTVVTDYKGKAVTCGGAAKLSTTEKKFGRSSAYFDGNASYLSIPTSNDFVFGTGNFTVECWVKFGTRPDSVSLIDYFKAGTSGWQLLVNADGYPQWYQANPGEYALTGSTKVNDNSWHHILVSRYGAVLYMFIDGAYAGHVDNSKNYTSGADMLAIGAQMSTRNASYDYVGYIDEVRITKECRNRRAFEPSGLPMPNF